MKAASKRFAAEAIRLLGLKEVAAAAAKEYLEGKKKKDFIRAYKRTFDKVLSEQIEGMAKAEGRSDALLVAEALKATKLTAYWRTESVYEMDVDQLVEAWLNPKNTEPSDPA